MPMTDNQSLLDRQKELVAILNDAALVYYSGATQKMSDKEYDELYDELRRTEEATGVVLDESPTQRIGFKPISKFKPSNHEVPAPSLDKTKELDKLKEWFRTHILPSNSKEGVLSWKCDGLTLVVTYEDGKLVKAVTRGDGYIGEDVTVNAPYIKGLPQTIAFTDPLIIRGEVVTSIADFNAINSLFESDDDMYANARNFTTGSLRNTNPKFAAVRRMQFRAFEYVKGKNITKLSKAFDELESLGFSVVEHKVVTEDNFNEVFQYFKDNVTKMDIPTDGLVLAVNDLAYAKMLGITGKYSNSGFAFKWKDAEENTTLRAIEWSPSRTGRLNPVAVFDTVQLEGTDVTRASVHNISVMKDLHLSLGATIYVYKANMIIPQISSCDSHIFTIPIPAKCPICNEPTQIKVGKEGATFLYCTNSDCAARQIGNMERFVSREGLNIKGVSTSIIEMLVGNHIIHTASDILTLPNQPDLSKLVSRLDGFGMKSYQNMIQAINTAKTTTFKQFIYCLGIEGIGHEFANIVYKHFATSDNNDKKVTDCLEALLTHDTAESKTLLASMRGVGPTTADAFVSWYKQNKSEYDRIKSMLNITDDVISARQIADNKIKGKTFVITGSLNHYPNRNALINEIVLYGGKVAGSVSNKTDYLINNDITSTSGKNGAAKSLGIPIISEDDYINLLPKS